MGQEGHPRENASSLGVIAGSGRLPIEALRSLSLAGETPRLYGFEGLSDPESAVDATLTKLGQLDRLLSILHEENVGRVLILGKFPKTLLLDGGAVFDPDAEAMKLLARAADWQDEGIMAGVASWLESKGVSICAQDEMLPSMLVPSGAMTERLPSDAERADARVGFGVVARLGGSGVGQAVGLRRGAVLALEAIEGTDAMIERAGELGGAGATIVKATRPGQDRRFDLPAVGPETIRAMRRARATALFVEAGSTLVVEADSVKEEADAAGITIWGFDPNEIQSI